MAHQKVNLQWITNDSTRRCTFKKRSNALMKKASKLATLSGIKVSVVAYGDDEAMPEIYPSVPEARQLLTSFKAMPDYHENFKKVLNQEEYLRSRISKLRNQKGKSDPEKREDETSHLLHAAMAGHSSALTSLTTEELIRLKWMVEKRMRNAEARFEQILGQEVFQEPLVAPQEQPMLSSQSQVQAPYTCTEMQTLAPAEESQPQEQDWLADLAWDGGELEPMVYSDIGTTNGGIGPSTSARDNVGPNTSAHGGVGPSTGGGVGPSTSAGDIMQQDIMEGSEYPWSWDPLVDIE